MFYTLLSAYNPNIKISFIDWFFKDPRTLIALFALVWSIFIYFKARQHLYLFVDRICVPKYIDTDWQTVYHRKESQYSNKYIINDSSHNITYFDVEIVDVKNNCQMYYNLFSESKFKHIELFHYIDDADKQYKLHPFNNISNESGFFKSNSVTSFDIVLDIDRAKEADKIIITFKTPQFSIF